MASAITKTANLVSNIVVFCKPKVFRFMYYAKTELTPPKISDIPEITKSVKHIMESYKKGTWKQLTVKEAFLNTLVAIEVTCWFYIGECIGKRRVIGYKIK